MASIEVVLIAWSSAGEPPRLLGRSTEPDVVETVRAHLHARCGERLRQLRASGARPGVARGVTGEPRPGMTRLVRTDIRKDSRNE